MADRVDTDSERITIVLADDHAMVRAGLRRVLDAERDLEVVGEAGDVGDALRLARAFEPKIIVLDLRMPGRSTLDAIPDFLDGAPGSAVIVLTVESEPTVARLALSGGAHGHVLKEAAGSELVEAVRAVAAGRIYLDPSLGARLAMARPSPKLDARWTASAGPRFEPGAEFAGHRIEAVLGRGGMGVVYRAVDVMLERTVALKLISPEVADDAVFRARFERECRLAAAVDHAHVVEIFHAGEEDGLLYLTMRYVRGPDLGKVLRHAGRVAAPRAAALVGQVASALDEAHRLRLVHRDVKPANVLVEERSGGEHAFLTDFGLTKPASGASMTQTARALGTLDYIAPEQARGEHVDQRADVYSLGCVLFQMLTGHVVFEGDSDVSKLWAHVHEPPPRLSSLRRDLPPPLDDVLARALAKDPAERQQSAGELAREATSASA